MTLVALLALLVVETGDAVSAHQDRIEQQPVYLENVGRRCYANATEISCVFTNPTAYPVASCVRGIVQKKQGGDGLTVKSQPVCSGALPPFTTKDVVAYWDVGEPTDLCEGESAFGGKGLDWGKCTFTVTPMPKGKLPEDES